MSKILKICVLICGDPNDKLKNERGHYGNFFESWSENQKKTFLVFQTLTNH